MVFNFILMFVLFAIVFIFLYMAYQFKRDANRKITYEGDYSIELNDDFLGDSLSIYVNDSILFKQTVKDSTTLLQINRFAEEHMLMVVDAQTDRATSFNLSDKGSRVKVSKSQNEIVFTEKGKK